MVLNRSQQWCTNCAWRAYMEMSLTQTLWGSTENSCDSLDPGDVSSGSVRFFFKRSKWQLAAVAALLWHQHGGVWLIAPWICMDPKTEALHGWKWCHFRDFITNSKLKSWSQVQAFVFVDHWWLLQIEGFRVVSIVTWKDLLDRLFSCFDAGTNFKIQELQWDLLGPTATGFET